MKIGSLFAVFLVAASSLLPAEEVLSCFTNASWVTPHWRTFSAMDEFLEIEGWVHIVSKRSFEVNPEDEYELTGSFRTPGDQKELTRLEFGFIPIDADEKIISPETVLNYGGPLYTLASNAKAGDTSAVIKTSGKIRNPEYLAFNAKADFSDLPNPEVYQCAGMAEEGKEFRISLKKPLKKDYAQGTMMRRHLSGRLWTGCRGKKAGREWTLFSGRIKGIGKQGTRSVNQWWPGTERAKIFILIGGKNRIQFKDVTVRKISK